MTTRDVQQRFPHTCAGHRCRVCWWVAVRPQEQESRRVKLLSRLHHLTQAYGASARSSTPSTT